jgi:hypothetical protein
MNGVYAPFKKGYMMNNILINRSKESTVDFDIKIDGASVEDAKSRLVIQCDGYSLSFDCNKTAVTTFSSNIPPVSFLKKGVHDFCIEVIINNQLFVPLKGSVTIVDEVTITASTSTQNNKSTEDEELEVITPFSMNRFLQSRNASEEQEQSTVEDVQLDKVKNIISSMSESTNNSGADVVIQLRKARVAKKPSKEVQLENNQLTNVKEILQSMNIKTNTKPIRKSKSLATLLKDKGVS